MKIDEVQQLWFDGDAWCKAARLDERGSADGRPMERRIHEATERFRADGDALDLLLKLLVDDLLCEQLPESSWFAEYERRPWVPCSKDQALAIARPLQQRLGCEAGARGLAWIEGLDGHWFRFDSGGIEAIAVLNDELGAFFLDRG